MKTNTFDRTVMRKFSELLRDSKVFQFDEGLSKKFRLAYVIRNRLQDAMSYLDRHCDPPKTDGELLLFMAYADNLFSAIQSLFTDVFGGRIDYPYKSDNSGSKNTKYFSKVFEDAFPNVSDDKIPTDDQFFRYFRALSLAHPYETSRYKFIPNGEVHYSPFVLNNNNAGLRNKNPQDLMGAMVCSNMRDDFWIVFPYSVMKDFLISRYNTLKLVANYIQGLLDAKKKEWESHKIDRTKPLVAVWTEIRDIYSDRHQDSDPIDEVIQHLTVTLSPDYPKNADRVAKFRAALEAITFKVCDCVEAFDYEGVIKLINTIVDIELPDDDAYKGLNYSKEKVAGIYFGQDENQDDRLESNLDILMKSFCRKWVDVDQAKMSRQEIWLLISAAWYLEAEKCRKSGKLNVLGEGL